MCGQTAPVTKSSATHYTATDYEGRTLHLFLPPASAVGVMESVQCVYVSLSNFAALIAEPLTYRHEYWYGGARSWYLGQVRWSWSWVKVTRYKNMISGSLTRVFGAHSLFVANKVPCMHAHMPVLCMCMRDICTHDIRMRACTKSWNVISGPGIIYNKLSR